MKADKNKVNNLLKTARGQVEGILKMVEEDRYCIDISNQILATYAILSKVNTEILKSHLEHCVKDAINSNDVDSKVKELEKIIEKMAEKSL
ncbi:MAG: metal-sensing transcriptional repressor [Bacilli bacterium]|nr:metal-sensing transcriptional repressor [Bacilli bacterium]